MGSAGFLKFAFKHIVLLAWPSCALGYPLYASVRAIETKSEEETRNLTAYWISFSAILLFEYVFEKLLGWLVFWCYVKLVVVFCLVTDDFAGSVYVYNHLFRPCLSLNPRTLIDWFNEAKKSFVKKDKFEVELEKYVDENGTVALQNLLVAKGVNLGFATKDAKAVTEVEWVQVSASPGSNMFHSEVSHNHCHAAELGLSSTKFKKLKVECKGIEAVQKMTVNKQVTSTMPENEKVWKEKVPGSLLADRANVLFEVNEVEFNLPKAEKSDFLPPNVKEVQTISHVVSQFPKTALPQSVQKQWTCTICQVVTGSEVDLASHHRGRRHKLAYERSKVNNLNLKTAQVSPAWVKKNSSIPWSPEVIHKLQKPDRLKYDSVEPKDLLGGAPYAISSAPVREEWEPSMTKKSFSGKPR